MAHDGNILNYAGLAAQGFSVGASAVASYNKSLAEKYALDYQAKVAQNNAVLAEWRASDAINRGQVETARTQLRTRQLKGTQRANLAAKGIDLSEGSALNLLTDTDVIGAIDANTTTDNAAREAYGYKQEAANYKGNADNLRKQAKSTSPFGASFSTLLTGATGVASSWYNLKEKEAL